MASWRPHGSLAACAVQFQKRQTSVSSQCRFQVQVSTPGGEEALPKPFRISYIHVEFSDATLNHFFEDPRPYTDDESTLDAARTMRTTDRTGKSFEWIDCTQCTFGDTAVKSQTAWKKNVSLDIRPFETKVLEGVIVPATEQVVKVGYCIHVMSPKLKSDEKAINHACLCHILGAEGNIRNRVQALEYRPGVPITGSHTGPRPNPTAPPHAL